MNRRPLFIAVGIGALAFIGISYAFLDKQASGHNISKQEEQASVDGVSKSPVNPDDAITTSSTTGEENKEKNTDSFVDNQQKVDDRQKYEPRNEMSEVMKDRLKKLQQLEEKRLAKWEEALDSDITVQGFDSVRGNMDQQVAMRGGDRVHSDDLVNRYLAGLENQEVAMMGGAGVHNEMSIVASPSMPSENQQARKKAFLQNVPEAEVYLNRERHAALLPAQEIKAGWIIPAVMISGINSDLPGQIIGQVREAVYDSATGTQCLIPPGSRLFGTYDSGITLGQDRALVAWQRIIYPDGSSLSIENMPGSDMSGYAGFKDKVNNHYVKTFASGIMLSIFSAGVQLSQPQAKNGENYNSSQIMAGALGQQMGQIGMQMAQRNMNIQPTIKIRPGYEFNIMVTKDIILPTWEGHPMAGNHQKNC